ncbi:MAG: site-2 protease family protein [Myxococcales bacterium]|nr:site-2 protease family protein [Myxococcales bacterium]
MSPFIVAAVIVFVGVLIFVHEMGHFLAAKAFGIEVTKFSLGFGPPLLSFTWGETTYQVALVPLGGYVRMRGEHYDEGELSRADAKRAFNTAPVHQRAIIALAGPLANLLFPVVCFFAYNLLEPEVIPAVIGQVEAGEPADKAGLRPGDRILSVDGQRTWSFERLVQLISHRPNDALSLKIRRDQEILDVEVTPKAVVGEDLFGQRIERGMISVSNVFDGARVGVIDEARLSPSGEFQTGDTILSIADQPIRRADDLLPAFTSHLGKRVTVQVGRPNPALAGALISAERSELVTLYVLVPQNLSSLSDLGLSVGSTFVRELAEGGAAERAGFLPGDRILEVNGRLIQHFWRLQTILKEAEAEPVSVTIQRSGQMLSLTLRQTPVTCVHMVTRKLRTVYDPGFGRGGVPEDGLDCEDLYRPFVHWGQSISPKPEPAELSIEEAFMDSLRLTGQVMGLITTSLIKLITREVSADTVGGPLQFMNVAAQAAEAGMLAYLRWLAFISINLGVFNLLPVPILDGGHLLLCLIEAVKRKPLSIQTRERAAMVGLALLAMLLILALRNDLRSLEIF